MLNSGKPKINWKFDIWKNLGTVDSVDESWKVSNRIPFYTKHKKYPIIENKQNRRSLFDTCHLQDYYQTKQKRTG